MNYINLNLKQHGNQDNKIYLLDEMVQKHEIVILLGAPGSGKTSILKKYENENNNHTQFFKVDKFLEITPPTGKTTKVLLLDGLDEYRSVASNRAFVMTRLGHKINELPKNIKVVISCREMDWYGETDVKALRGEISRKPALYSILPLDKSQMTELAGLFEIKKTEVFIEKFSGDGFLNNPQMFKMLAEIYKDDSDKIIGSKKELYLTFIKKSREQNLNNKTNRVNEIDADEFLKYAGYIAFYYIFSNIDKCDDAFVDQISDAYHGYNREKIEIVRKSTLFSEGEFFHRTIAEFSLANFITKHKLEKKQLIEVERIKNLFVKKKKVPTELRGTFAWLCALTGKEAFINIDPYYQIVHGDNSFFDNELKKKIVLEIKQYAQKENPYFFEFGQTMGLEGFYKEALDNFFFSEFNEALEVKNDYMVFIINAIISTHELSDNMKKFLKEKILENTQGGYKYLIMKAFRSDIYFLQDVLSDVKTGKLSDDKDTLKEVVLSTLYPDYIGSKEISEYLILYSDHTIGHCDFLYNTVYKYKFSLIDKIYLLSFDKTKSIPLSLPKNVKSFIEDYFLETLLKFENGLPVKEIYKVIKHFKNYYEEYETLRFNSFRYNITDEMKKSDEKLDKLANKLFSLFIDDELLKDTKDIDFYLFNYFFDYRVPNNQSAILLGKMKNSNSFEINRILFWAALNKDINIEKLNSVAQEFGLEEELIKWQNPLKSKWAIKGEKAKRKREKKEKKLLAENERYFAGKTDTQIISTFGDLHFISKFFYLDHEPKENKYLEEKTLERLKGILKNAIFQKNLLDPELLTLNSIAKNSPDARRNIDIMYSVSCVLNESLDIKVINDDFRKYLYINCLQHNTISDTFKGDFIKRIEKKHSDFTLVTIKEYIELLLDNYLAKQKNLMMFYVNRESDIEELKYLTRSSSLVNGTIQENILYNFLDVFNFNISLIDLNILSVIAKKEHSMNIILALKSLLEENKDSFSINMAINLYSLFQYKKERFKQLQSDYQVKIIDYMMNQFNTDESIEFVGGFQSRKAMCASFLNRSALNLLDHESLKALQKIRKNENDIWKPRIAYEINKFERKESDQAHTSYSIKKIKNFIISNAVISKEDFFTEICLKLDKLKNIFEDNIDNNREPFYNQDGSPKNEESCRDVVYNWLKGNHGYDMELTKEKYIANNRADISIKYKADINFVVQVECKKGNTKGIYKGISEQLIGKYFSSEVRYGVYLIFYFGKPIKKKLLLKKINSDIPDEYKNNIKIICIDLT